MAKDKFFSKEPGAINQPDPPMSDLRALQAPQAPEGRHDKGYDNDVADGWLRGGGRNGAEGKPGFDKHRAGR